jgi:AcrR family transcriptional regulator
MTAARELFTERGYDGVGTEEIVRAAGVTRGALYHHFGGKAELLEAVYERLEAESTERVARVVLGSELESPLEAMRAGIEAFLDECAKPELQRIALHDAPAVLGWERWREIAAANGLGLIEASLSAAIEAGEMRELPVRPTAHLLLGALDEAAMLVARSEDPDSRAEVTVVLLALLESFAVPGSP